MIVAVVPTYNNLEMLVRCVESVRDMTTGIEWRMIVVDNGSTDGTKDYLIDVCDEDKRIERTWLDENKGFIGGTNAGLHFVKSGEHVLLLNDDTQVVNRDWLELLDAQFDNPKVGAVGPVSNYASVWQSASESYHIPKLVHSTKVLIGFCMLIRAEVFQKVGLLDERFADNQFEDYDYSFRIADAGYELRVCRDVFVLHYGSRSTSRVGQREFQEKLQRGQTILCNKWGEQRFRAALALPEDLRDTEGDG